MHSPKTAYVLLWFPLSSETFVFREVQQLTERGLPVHVYSLYDKALRGCSKEMRNFSGAVTRLGIISLFSVLWAFGGELVRRPAFVWQLLREGLFRHTRSWETVAENTWAFFAAFRLAELWRADGIELIVTPWANGPGTAAWLGSRLTGIPYVLTGRAGDIYPPDGILQEKLRDASLVRVNNATNVGYLAAMCPAGQQGKVRLVYNSLTFTERSPRVEKMHNPCKLLAVGRFVRTKGFDILLESLHMLRTQGFNFHLTLVGNGWWRRRLTLQCHRLGLCDVVTMPGFLPHDVLQKYMLNHDMLIVPSVVDPCGDRDGIPNVIMEALSHLLPVVSTNVAGISEVVRHGQTGLLVPQRNVEQLALAVRHMAENREEALHMAEEGRTLVEQMFDAEKNITALYELYGEAHRRARQG